MADALGGRPWYRTCSIRVRIHKTIGLLCGATSRTVGQRMRGGSDSSGFFIFLKLAVWNDEWIVSDAVQHLVTVFVGWGIS
jgi:hypothetical protein